VNTYIIFLRREPRGRDLDRVEAARYIHIMGYKNIYVGIINLTYVLETKNFVPGKRIGSARSYNGASPRRRYRYTIGDIGTRRKTRGENARAVH